MENQPKNIEEMLDTFMSNQRLKDTCATQLRIMARDPATNTQLLSQAVGTIQRNFTGNDEKITECVNRLYHEYKKRTGDRE